MKITDRLIADHKVFRKIIQELDGLTRKSLTKRDRTKLVRLVATLKDHLIAHAWFEDMFYYPVARQAIEGGGSFPPGALFMSLLDREHRVIEDRLGCLERQVRSAAVSADWPRTFSLFFQELAAHMNKEEETLFPLSEKLLGADLLEEISREADRRRSEAPKGRSGPRARPKARRDGHG